MSMRLLCARTLRTLMLSAAGLSFAVAQVPETPPGNPPVAVPPTTLPPALPTDSSARQINYGRLAVMGGITVGFFGGSYLYVKKYWWADQQTSFHFDKSPEQYAKNMDKVAHFFWGFVGGDLAGVGFRWAGVEDDPSLIYGGVMNAIISLSIEMTDGYAPSHGFSIGDLAAGVVGGFYPLMQRHIGFLKPLNFKMSYWNHEPGYYDKQSELIEHNPARFFADNYGNQTYWALLNLQQISPGAWKPWMPAWLSLGVGVRAGEVVDVIGTDKQFKNVQVYLTLDVDVPALLPKEGAFWQVLGGLFKYYHFPAPALRISPNVAVFGFYM